jgi:hypothetical protein
MKTFLSLVIALGICAGPVLSQEALTGDEVEHFLNTLEKLGELPELQSEPPTQPSDMNAAELEARMKAPFSASLEEMRGHEQFGEGLAIMKSEGFEDETEWASVGDRVMHAYAALQMEGKEPDMDAQMAKAMKELEASDLPEEMKQKMRDAMTISKGMVESMADVPPGDIEAIRPFISRFESLARMPQGRQ